MGVASQCDVTGVLSFRARERITSLKSKKIKSTPTFQRIQFDKLLRLVLRLQVIIAKLQRRIIKSKLHVILYMTSLYENPRKTSIEADGEGVSDNKSRWQWVASFKSNWGRENFYDYNFQRFKTLKNCQQLFNWFCIMFIKYFWAGLIMIKWVLQSRQKHI